MGEGDHWGWPPTGSPGYAQREDQWRHFDSSVDAMSFGFVATAILISMFLVMAIFERFLRPNNSPESSPAARRLNRDVESQMGSDLKLRHPSPKISENAREVSVLMPGENVPTFIANPAPVPCPPERISWPNHQQKPLAIISQGSGSSNGNSS